MNEMPKHSAQDTGEGILPGNEDQAPHEIENDEQRKYLDDIAARIYAGEEVPEVLTLSVGEAEWVGWRVQRFQEKDSDG